MATELIRAFFLIFIAEMGDKTQIIAMTFATQYKVKEVLAGVFLGVFLNHGLAIILGRYISTLIPMDWAQLAGGVLFIIFGLLSLKVDDGDGSGQRKNFSPVIAVALAFFIGELGDKTQLTAMTLAVEGKHPFFVLLGTIFGMVATSSLGIFIGNKIGRRIPDVLMKIISSWVFIFCGTLKLYRWMPEKFLNSHYIISYFVIVMLIQTFLIIRLIIIRKGDKELSPIKKAAATLYIQTKVLENAIEDICLGEECCGNCSKTHCIIGYTKDILKTANDEEIYYIKRNENLNRLENREFNEDKVLDALSLIIIDYVKYGIIRDEKFIMNQVRECLETILLGRRIKFSGDLDEYMGQFTSIDDRLGKKLKHKIDGKVSSSFLNGI